MHPLVLPPLTPVALPANGPPLWLQAARVSVAAGFPSPAEDHQVERIDLMAQLVRHPQATFFIRISGDSMRDAGILDGSVVLVDKAIKPRHGQIVIAVIDGDYTCAPGECASKLRTLSLPTLSPAKARPLKSGVWSWPPSTSTPPEPRHARPARWQ